MSDLICAVKVSDGVELDALASLLGFCRKNNWDPGWPRIEMEVESDPEFRDRVLWQLEGQFQPGADHNKYSRPVSANDFMRDFW